jgi:hypothetical protein
MSSLVTVALQFTVLTHSLTLTVFIASRNFFRQRRRKPHRPFSGDLVDENKKVPPHKFMRSHIPKHRFYQLRSQRFDTIPNQAQPARLPPVMQKPETRVQSRCDN